MQSNTSTTPGKLNITIPGDVASRNDLKQVTKMVLGAIVSRFGKNGYSFPSIKRIANDCGTSESSDTP